MSDFLKVSVLPSHGEHQAVLQWTMQPGFRLGTFTIQRALSAPQGWVDIGTVVNDDTFIDTDMVLRNRQDEYFYRIQRTDDQGIVTVSPSTSTFGEIDRETYGRACCILMKESQIMRRRGTEILILRQRLEDKPCPRCVDPDTGQREGTTLCDTCYGTGFAGGYHKPIKSWMREGVAGAKAVKDDPGGGGSDDTTEVGVRLLGIPALIKGDLIIDPKQDRRFLVQSLTPFHLRSRLTVFFEGPLHLLRRSDVRYKIKV